MHSTKTGRRDPALQWNDENKVAKSYSGLKTDLVMWTLNAESTLERSLHSIETAVPGSVICHRCPVDCPRSTDGALRKILFEKGWKWRVYQDVVSEHYRDSFSKHLKHVVMQSAVGKVLWETYPEYPMNSKLGRFLATPLTAAKIASESSHPGVFVAYPLLRGVKALSRVIGSVSKKYEFIEVRTQS